MLKTYSVLICVLYGLINAAVTNAQSVGVPDSNFYQSLNASAASTYSKSIDENWGLFNGSEYVGSYSRTIGHPYFESDKLQPGNIFYDGTFYRNVQLLFDLSRGEVITPGHGQNFNIKLVPEKIAYFSVLNHLFVKLEPDSGTNSSITPGFYDMLVAGKMPVFVKRIKQLETGSKVEDNLKFVQYDKYFVRKDKTYYPVDSEKSLLALFGDQKPAVKKYLRGNGLKYRRDPATTIAKAVEYYTPLKN